jgi:hypothetical protein
MPFATVSKATAGSFMVVHHSSTPQTAVMGLAVAMLAHHCKLGRGQSVLMDGDVPFHGVL